MAIESAVMFRRVARVACLVFVAGLLTGVAAKAQLPIKAPAPVTVGSVVPFSHGSTGAWIQIYSMKQDPIYGHILFLDSAGSVIYDMAPGASTPTEVVGPEPSNKDNSDCSLLEFKGSYWNAAVAFDKWDNLYVTDRFGSAVQFCRVPYDASSGTWLFSNADIWKGPTYTNSGGQTVAIPPQDLQVADDGVTFYVSTSDTEAIYKYVVNQAGTVTSVTALITGLEAGATQLAVDHAGNLYFVENQGDYPNNVHGIREIAAGTAPIVGDGTGAAESALPRIDEGGWNGINGMYVDPQGDMYFASTNNISYGGQADGVFMIPNEGTPTSPKLVWTDTVMVSPVDGGYPPMVDKRGFVWIATSYYNNWAPAGVNGPNCDTTDQQTATATCLESTIVQWEPGALNLGNSTVGGPAAVPITAYSVPAGGGSVQRMLQAHPAFLCWERFSALWKRRDVGGCIQECTSCTRRRRTMSKPKYSDVNPFSKLHPGEPWFFLRAQDQLSVAAVKQYAVLLQNVADQVSEGDNLSEEEAMKLSLSLEDQAAQVAEFAMQFREWQIANPDKVKLPD